MILKSIFNLNNQNISTSNFFEKKGEIDINIIYKLPYVLPLINNQLYQTYFKPILNKIYNITTTDPENKEEVEKIINDFINNNNEFKKDNVKKVGESTASHKIRINKELTDRFLNNMYFTDK